MSTVKFSAIGERRPTHRPIAVALMVVLPIMLSGRGRAQDLPSELIACAKLGDSLERVTCYDRLTARVRAEMTPAASAITPGTATAPPAVPTVTGSRAAPAAALPATPPPPANSASAQDMFGARPVETPAVAPERKELKSITARVTGLREKPNGTIIDLDNGQEWQQLGHEDLLMKLGERVTLSRGAFSSFWIMSESNRSDHVKRLL